MLNSMRLMGWVVAGLAFSSTAAMARQAERVLLVIPARYTVVQFAFDMARVRDVSLVAYDQLPKTTEPVLHVWDPQSRAWERISLSAYSSGSMFADSIDRAILVGNDATLPASLAESTAWADKVDRIQSLQIADLANGMAPILKFSPAEWQWLSRRYELKLEDQNWERRRYGKYGKPGKERSMPPAARQKEAAQAAAAEQPQDATTLEPAPVVEEVPAPMPADVRAIEETPETGAGTVTIPPPAAPKAPEDK